MNELLTILSEASTAELIFGSCGLIGGFMFLWMRFQLSKFINEDSPEVSEAERAKAFKQFIQFGIGMTLFSFGLTGLIWGLSVGVFSALMVVFVVTYNGFKIKLEC